MDSEFVQDWEMTKKRFEAWWHNETIDRPVVFMQVPREKPRWPLRPMPGPGEAEASRYYLDAQLCVDAAENVLASTDYFGDAYPLMSRGVNTGYLGSFAGAELTFSSEGGVWMDPSVTDWSAAPASCSATSRT